MHGLWPESLRYYAMHVRLLFRSYDCDHQRTTKVMLSPDTDSRDPKGDGTVWTRIRNTSTLQAIDIHHPKSRKGEQSRCSVQEHGPKRNNTISTRSQPTIPVFPSHHGLFTRADDELNLVARRKAMTQKGMVRRGQWHQDEWFRDGSSSMNAR